MINKLIYLILVATVIVGCQKKDEPMALECTFFELGSCFSTQSLSGENVIITNTNDYKVFETSIRRHFYAYCDTVFLPEINFDEFFFAGTFTSTSGCSADYVRNIFYDVGSEKYSYEIQVTSVGDCEMVISSFNCAVIPKQSNNYIVDYSITLQ